MLSSLFTDLAPPLQGQVFLVAHTATPARYEIPPQWRGCMVTFTSTGSDLTVLFGDATVSTDVAEVGTATSEVLTSNWASGTLIPAGASRPFPIPMRNDRPDITHFVVDGSAAVGYWCAEVSSGNPKQGEHLNTTLLGKPLLNLDAGVRSKLQVDSGAVTVANWRCLENNYTFSEGTNKPDLFTAVAASSGMLRPAVSFVRGSTEKLQSTDAILAAALGSSNPFTIVIAFRRTETAQNNCLFSVGTTGTDNGRWDITIDSSDDVVMTRVDSAGNSTASTFAATVSAAMHTIVITFDGTDTLLWLDNTSQTFTGATGDVGTTTKVTVGARAYNTATVGNYASAEISRVLVFPECFTTTKLTELRAFIRRASGV